MRVFVALFLRAMNGNIYINGLIGNLLDEKGKVKEHGIHLIDVIAQVKRQPQAESFKVYIASEGGDFVTGYEIYNYLKSLQKPIHTIGQGFVGSIATVVYAAGETRELKPGTKFHPHLPSGGVSGNSDDIQAYASVIKEAEKQILKTYRDDVGLSENEILPILKKDESITAEQAYSLGFATIKPMESQPVVAYFNKQKPNKKMSKEKSKWAQIKALLLNLPITNKVVFDAEGKELDFYELEDSATIEVGAKANYDGKAAEGDYMVQSEEDAAIVLTYVFESGVLLEIKEPEVEEVVEEVEEEMTALKAEVETLKTQLQEITAKKTELETENKNYKKAIMAIKKLESEIEPEVIKKQPLSNRVPETKNETSDAVANWRKNKQLKTKK